VIAALLTWFTRPNFAEVDERTKARLTGTEDPAAPAKMAREGRLTCVIDRSRSRITVSDTADVPFEWTGSGCVNGRTQYAEEAGRWVRSFVPNNEAQVSVTSFQPDSSSYRIERHLLGSEAMQKARAARKQYDVKSCSADPAMLEKVASMNAAVRQLLPQQPNELLVFKCN
jgi:serine protease Do